MLLYINPDKPDKRQVRDVVDCVRGGGVIIYPTDTVYGMGCDIHQSKAVERICRIKKIDCEKANFSFICSDLSHLSDYCKPIDTTLYRVLRKALPGPFTFIFEANGNVPKLFKSKKKTVGIRVPAHAIPRELVTELGNPIMSTSVHSDDDLLEYTTDPEQIYEKYKTVVDIVIAGGFGNLQPSTVVDCTEGQFEILRQGMGDLEQYM